MQRRWRIHELRGDVIVARRASLGEGDQRQPAPCGIRSDLVRWLAEPTTRAVLVAMYASLEAGGVGAWAGTTSLHTLDARLIERLCTAFTRGELFLDGTKGSNGRSAEGPPQPSAGDPTSSCGAPSPQVDPSEAADFGGRPPSAETTTWIEIEMHDTAQRPAAGRRYRVTLPDGSVREGRLSAAGYARIDGIDGAGVCKVSFPDLDRREWRRA